MQFLAAQLAALLNANSPQRQLILSLVLVSKSVCELCVRITNIRRKLGYNLFGPSRKLLQFDGTSSINRAHNCTSQPEHRSKGGGTLVVGRGVSIISDILRFSPDAQLQTRIQSCCSVRLKSLPYPFSVNCTFLLVSCRCSQLALTQLQFLLLLRSNSPLSGFWTFVAKLFCFFPHRLLWLTFFSLSILLAAVSPHSQCW